MNGINILYIFKWKIVLMNSKFIVQVTFRFVLYWYGRCTLDIVSSIQLIMPMRPDNEKLRRVDHGRNSSGWETMKNSKDIDFSPEIRTFFYNREISMKLLQKPQAITRISFVVQISAKWWTKQITAITKKDAPFFHRNQSLNIWVMLIWNTIFHFQCYVVMPTHCKRSVSNNWSITMAIGLFCCHFNVSVVFAHPFPQGSQCQQFDINK